jgi:hypothetical protein
MKQRDVFGRLGRGSWGKLMRRPLIASVLILVLVAQSGCAGNGSGKRSTPALLFPLPREVFQQLGTVAVTSGRFAPTFDIEGGPWKGGVGSVAKGGLEGFFVPFQLGAVGNPLVLPIIAVLMPVGLVAGAIEGARAEPAVKVEEREAAIREMIAAQRIQDDLRDRVAAIGRTRTPHTLTVLADRGPSAAGEQPDYRSLSQEGVQTVLEVVVESVILKGGDSFLNVNPSLVLHMTVNGRLLRTVDNLEIHTKMLTYHGRRAQTLAEWVSDAEGFRYALNLAYADLAGETVREFLLRGLD